MFQVTEAVLCTALPVSKCLCYDWFICRLQHDGLVCAHSLNPDLDTLHTFDRLVWIPTAATLSSMKRWPWVREHFEGRWRSTFQKDFGASDWPRLARPRSSLNLGPQTIRNRKDSTMIHSLAKLRYSSLNPLCSFDHSLPELW
jgi:hypothetical protein